MRHFSSYCYFINSHILHKIYITTIKIIWYIPIRSNNKLNRPIRKCVFGQMPKKKKKWSRSSGRNCNFRHGSLLCIVFSFYGTQQICKWTARPPSPTIQTACSPRLLRKKKKLTDLKRQIVRWYFYVQYMSNDFIIRKYMIYIQSSKKITNVV